MTSVVGVLCQDGVVVATDSSATFVTGRTSTIEQPIEKLFVIPGNVIVATTGSVGHTQRFLRVCELVFDSLKGKDCHFLEVGKLLSHRALNDFAQTNSGAAGFGALVCFPLDSTFHLCEFPVGDFQPEFKEPSLWYVSMGSGQSITDPFLALMRSIFWKDGPPTVQDARFAVTWTLSHVIEVNPGGINAPIRLAVLENRNCDSGELEARIVDSVELDEHERSIEEAKNHLSKFVVSQQQTDTASDIPKPEQANRLQ